MKTLIKKLSGFVQTATNHLKKTQLNKLSIVVGFWMVFPKGNEWPPMIYPTLIAERDIKNIDDLKLSEVWNTNIQVPEGTDPALKFAMLNQVTMFKVDKIPESKYLLELPEVNAEVEKIFESLKT